MKYLLPIIFACFIFSSCMDNAPHKEGAKKQKKSYTKKKVGGFDVINAGATAQYTGKPGQLIVVADKTEYTDDIEELLDSVFGAYIRPYYPPTPYFEIHQRSTKDFLRLSTGFRNVLDLKIDEEVEKGNPTLVVYENYYSETQLYTKIRAHDMSDLYDKLESEVSGLFKLYDRQEWKREYLRHAKYKNKATREKLKEKFGIDLVLPRAFKYESIDDTYAIMILPERSRPMDLDIGSGSISKVNYIQTGIMVWQYPYTDKSQLEPENLVRMRDTILKKYMKHEMDGVYMGTQYHPAILPVHEALKIGGVEGYQFKGMYKFTGEAEPSGGRYWEFQFKHPYRNTIVAISSYMDIPPTMSAKLDINSIRAVIYSMKPVE